jgi:hypothetical protein
MMAGSGQWAALTGLGMLRYATNFVITTRRLSTVLYKCAMLNEAFVVSIPFSA